jgi:hypothetical protein
MDTGKVFVLLLSIFAISILVYLELKSRRSRRMSESSSVETDNNPPKMPTD